MNRLRLLDFRTSRGPKEIGICNSDLAGCAEWVNSAQRKLVFAREAGEMGWWGSWASIVFNVSQAGPYITAPRFVARIGQMSVCKHPINIQNQFYEMMEFGIGPQPRLCPANCNFLECYDRGAFPTFTDLTLAPQYLRVTSSLPDEDSSKRILFQGEDSAGNIIYTQQGTQRNSGEFVSMENPFAQSTNTFGKLTGIQKDVTNGQIQIHQVDPTTGDTVLLLVMEPGETVASYRRYFINGLPPNCCNTGTVSTVQVDTMCKLELIPAVVDTDYLLIQNLEALISECQSIRYGNIDTVAAKQMSAQKHTEAIRLLQGELVHYLGKLKPAVSFKPFGSASLETVNIGMQ